MSFDDLVALSIVLLFLAFLTAEALMGGGRSFPKIRLWSLIGVAGFMVTFAVNAVLPAVFVPYLTAIHLVDLSKWGLIAALPTVVLTTFLTYWTHRLQHRFDILWRAGHQLHHGVARVDIASSMIFHPVDLAVQIAASTLAAGLLGATPEAAGVAGVGGFFLGLFQHWNVRTPQWVGYIIQRPESHCLHHERDVHARNFGDMPVWDMIFGTFMNPKAVDVAVGFEPERSRRWLAMVCFVDVNQTEGRAKI